MMRFAISILTLGSVITTTSAWVNPTTMGSSSKLQQQQKKSFIIPYSHLITTDLQSNRIDEEGITSDRRNFLSASAVLVSSGIATASLGMNADVVNAAETTSSTTTIDYKYYTPEQHSLDSKVILITGGTTGLGLESAKRLAYGGATVIVTARTDKKGTDAVASVKEYLQSKNVENPNIYSVQLDLDDLDNVRQVPQRIKSTLGDSVKIDVLLNNAGVMAIPTREVTKDGYERTFQSNHLGHFLLTNKLLPLLTESNPRIINVSSEAHKIPGKGGLQLDNLNGEKEYGPWTSYGQSKLANVLFTEELQQRANAAGKSLTAVTLHPGAVQTDLARNLIGPEKWEQMKNTGIMSFTDKLLLNVLSKFVISVEEGASTQVFLAATDTPSVVGGKYYDKCQVQKLDTFANDSDKAKQLWEKSEEWTGEKFQL